MARQEVARLLGQIDRQLNSIDDDFFADVTRPVAPAYQRARDAFAGYSSFVEQKLLKAQEVTVKGPEMFERERQPSRLSAVLANASYDVTFVEIQKRAFQRQIHEPEPHGADGGAGDRTLALALSWLITRALTSR